MVKEDMRGRGDTKKVVSDEKVRFRHFWMVPYWLEVTE